MLLQQHSSMMIESEHHPTIGLLRRVRGREDALRPGSFCRRMLYEAWACWRANAWILAKERESLAAATNLPAAGHVEAASKPSRPSRPKLSRSPDPTLSTKKSDLDEMNPRRRDELMRRQWLIEDSTYMDRQISELRQAKAMLKVAVESCSEKELYDNQCLYTNYARRLKKRKGGTGKETSSCSLPSLERPRCGSGCESPVFVAPKGKPTIASSTSCGKLPSTSSPVPGKPPRGQGELERREEKSSRTLHAQQVHSLWMQMQNSITQRDTTTSGVTAMDHAADIQAAASAADSAVPTTVYPAVRQMFRISTQIAKEMRTKQATILE